MSVWLEEAKKAIDNARKDIWEVNWRDSNYEHMCEGVTELLRAVNQLAEAVELIERKMDND